MVQKDCDINRLDILLMKLEIEPQVLTLWRYGDSRDGRNLLPPIEMMQDWSLSSRSPCPTNIWDEHKATFIEKCQMGPKFESFFLLLASVSSSNVLSPPRSSPVPCAPASDNSILILSTLAKYGWGDSELGDACESPRQHVEWSKGLSCTQKPKGLLVKALPIASSPLLKVWKDDPEMLCNAGHSPLPSERPVAIGILSLLKNQLFVPLPTMSCPSLATGSLVGVASPIASGFLEVSCPP
jgi:hypothetical protein